MSVAPTNPTRSGRSTALLFVVSAFVVVMSLAVGRAASALVPALWQDLVRQVVDAGLLFASFYGMARSGIPDLRPLSSLGFVRRPGISTEFGVGAALGWGIAVALVVPALLLGDLRMMLAWNRTALLHFAISLLVLVAFALVVQLIVSGLPMRLLVRAVGPGWATVAIVCVAIFLTMVGAAGQGRGAVLLVLAVMLFATAFLRTRAIWLPLGIQLGFTLPRQLLFGADLSFAPVASGVVRSDVAGPAWITGGAFGPEASLFAILILGLAFPILFRATRDYAWHYTYQPITGAGYPMDVAPPPEHVREEQRNGALVQIGGATVPQPGADS